jgi:hypothetical protein
MWCTVYSVLSHIKPLQSNSDIFFIDRRVSPSYILDDRGSCPSLRPAVPTEVYCGDSKLSKCFPVCFPVVALPCDPIWLEQRIAVSDQIQAVR